MDIYYALQIIVSIILIIFVGIILSKKTHINDHVLSFISKVIMYIAVPTYLISSIPTRFTRSLLITSFKNAYIPFIVIFFAFGISFIIGKRMQVKKNQIGAYMTAVAVSNTLFIGLPVNIGLFGDDSIPYVFVCFIANIVSFWTIGAYLIAKDGRKDEIGPINRYQLLAKNLLSPPIVAFALGMLMAFFNLRLPLFLQLSTESLGKMMTPLSLIYIGLISSKLKWHHIFNDPSILVMGLIKYGWSPIFMYILIRITHTPDLMGKVFLIQTVMPVLSIVGVLSKESGGDHQYAVSLTSTSLIMTLCLLPILILIIC